jgi:hypothetical protein
LTAGILLVYHPALAQQGGNATHRAMLTDQRRCKWDGSPLWWMKAPKTASTFGNLLARGICPGIHLKEAMREPDIRVLRQFHCDDSSRIGRFRPGHQPLPLSFGGKKMAIVSVFREPVSRVVSGYFHNLHDCRAVQNQFGINENSDIGLFKNRTKRRLVYGDDGVNPDVLLRYAKCVGACQTRMLLNVGCGDDRGGLGRDLDASHIDRRNIESLPRAAARAMVRRAVQRVASELAFVGVTERFKDTVRSMASFFSVRIVPRIDFLNTRPSWATSVQKTMASTALANVTLVDAFVYEAAYAWLAAFKRDCHVTERRR